MLNVIPDVSKALQAGEVRIDPQLSEQLLDLFSADGIVSITHKSHLPIV